MSKGITDLQLRETINAIQEYGVDGAAEFLGMSRGGIWHRQKTALARGLDSSPKAFSIPTLPTAKLSLNELLERRRAEWERVNTEEEARKLVPIYMKDPGPFALAVFGDLHLDDPGCNFPLLEDHTRIVTSTPHMYAAAVGDLQNSWTERLSRLWADQPTTAAEALMLVQWWVDELGDDLMWIVEGNHDAWARGINGVSPIEWIKKDRSFASHADGMCFELVLRETGPVGEKRSITVNCRHDFKGRSQFNAAHGLVKAALMGQRYDILLAGHIHEAGYSPIKDPLTGRVNHAVRVASYEHHDAYASRLGFVDGNLFECPVFIIQPDEEPRHQVTMIPNPRLAAQVLTLLRKEYETKSSGK